MMLSSSVLVHIIIILLVVTRCDIIHPFLIVKVPANGLLYAFLKLKARLPTKLSLEFSAVDSVTHVMSGTVCDVSDELFVLAFLTAQQTVYGLDENMDDVNVLPFD